MKCPFPARHRGNSPYGQGAEGHTGTVLSSPDAQGAGCSREDNPTAWMWQDNVHPVPPTAMTQRGFGPGFSTGFAGDIALCSGRSLLLGVKLLWRKGHNVSKLARSAPQSSQFQALVICKPSHDSSSAHEGIPFP